MENNGASDAGEAMWRRSFFAASLMIGDGVPKNIAQDTAVYHGSYYGPAARGQSACGKGRWPNSFDVQGKTLRKGKKADV